MIALNQKIEESLKNVTQQLITLLKVDRSLSTLNASRVQSRLQNALVIKFADRIEQSIYEVILSYAMKAEKISPGGFDSFIRNFIMKNQTTLKSSFKAKPATKFDIENLFDSYLDVNLKHMLIAALDLAGLTGKIVVEKSSSNITSVELVRGYTFKVQSTLDVFNATIFNSPKIVLIDGFIETVGELNKLLEQSYETKVPVLLFARGFANDVLNTLNVNYTRGMLLVVPIIVNFDFEGINTLVDIASVVNSDVVSSNKGDLISSISLDRLPSIFKATIYANKVVLENNAMHNATLNHIKHLKVKRDEEKEDALIRLIDLRIKSLTPNQVIIRLPNDQQFVIKSQLIDYVLRGIKSLIEYGVTEIESKPIATEVYGLMYALKCRKAIDNLGAIVVL